MLLWYDKNSSKLFLIRNWFLGLKGDFSGVISLLILQ